MTNSRRTELMKARVVSQEKDLYLIQVSPDLTVQAVLAGRLRHESTSSVDWPAVGDYVRVQPVADGRSLITEVLPRRSLMVRKQAGRGEDAQVIASNIDYLLIATSLNEDLNARRIERYLTLAWDSGAVPVLVLTKTDLIGDAPEAVSEVAAAFPGIDVYGVTAEKPETLLALKRYLENGLTAAVVGSSGVGKSTLVNHLLGREILKTQSIRADDGKGRHTTTSRQLLATPWGGSIIDTPGMRELQLLDNEEGLSRVFAGIEELSLQCKFTDCGHGNEPGCRIRRALEDGELSEEKWRSYLKQLGEIRHYVRKTNKSAASEEKKRWRKIHKNLSLIQKLKGK